MSYFLAKTDPETYAIDDLMREKKTVWNGVRNPQAVKVIKSMKIGDMVFVYESGKASAIVGLMQVVSQPRPDEKDPKSWVVDVQYIKKFPNSISLKTIKSTHRFDDWNLVYQSRLSTMAVPQNFIDWIKKNWPDYL